jgi:SNF family Na+-dependent transporter
MEEKGESNVLKDNLLKSYSLNGDTNDTNDSIKDSSRAVYRANGEDGVELVNHGEETQQEKQSKQRSKWDNKIQFMLTLIGYAVGLGNVWRFSYLVNRNGGGAFLIPYFVMLFLVGIPLFYLELSLGQALKLGPVKLWQKATPVLGGIGIAMTVASIYISLYYNVIVAWCLFYLVNSFTALLPWGRCLGHMLTGNITADLKEFENVTAPPLAINACISEPTRYYFYNTALQASGSVTDFGTFNWQMYLCLVGAWVLVYICLFRGVESSGKAVYITATFPFVILAILFFRGVTLPGAGDGLRYLFIPRNGDCFSIACGAMMLFSPRVWLEAATQIFFSLGLAQGALISLSTYTDEKMKAVRQSILVSFFNAFASIVVAIVVYSVLGFQATQEGADLKTVCVCVRACVRACARACVRACARATGVFC